MDKIVKTSKIPKALYMRGTHRMFGNPTVGTFTGFITAVFLIRTVANLYLVVDFSNRGGNIDVLQIASGLFIYLSSYAIGVGSIATYRISFALPLLCFINFSPGGKTFRSTFIKKAVFLRPVNLVSILILLGSILIFYLMGHNWQEVFVRAVIALLATALSIHLVLTVAFWSSPGKLEIQIIESLFLLFLVVINPDIIRIDNLISISFRGFYYSFRTIWNMIFSISLVALVSISILLLLKGFTVLGNRIHNKFRLNIIEAWYWRVFRIRFWAILYVIIIPTLILPYLSINIRHWILALYIIFNTLSYMYFVDRCKIDLREKWRCSLIKTRNVKLFTRSFFIHIFLSLIPVSIYIFCK